MTAGGFPSEGLSASASGLKKQRGHAPPVQAGIGYMARQDEVLGRKFLRHRVGQLPPVPLIQVEQPQVSRAARAVKYHRDAPSIRRELRSIMHPRLDLEKLRFGLSKLQHRQPAVRPLAEDVRQPAPVRRPVRLALIPFSVRCPSDSTVLQLIDPEFVPAGKIGHKYHPLRIWRPAWLLRVQQHPVLGEKPRLTCWLSFLDLDQRSRVVLARSFGNHRQPLSIRRPAQIPMRSPLCKDQSRLCARPEPALRVKRQQIRAEPPRNVRAECDPAPVRRFLQVGLDRLRRVRGQVDPNPAPRFTSQMS